MKLIKISLEDVTHLISESDANFLKKIGISVKIDFESVVSIGKWGIILNCDTDVLERLVGRNAGRKKGAIQKYRVNPQMSELEELKAKMGVKKLCKKIGCSETTFYKYQNSAKNESRETLFPIKNK